MDDYIWLLLAFAITTVTFVVMKFESQRPRNHLHNK